MSSTNGGRSKKFAWDIIPAKIQIQNEDGRSHEFELAEILEILKWLKTRFSGDWFPLANNVELMANGTEKDGLGTAILQMKPKDITHAQGASYLGVVLQEARIFEWNEESRGIQWRIIREPESVADLQMMITKTH